jgi:FtsP/CotA-like multicopper oxidase with cupredoxin domain
VVGPAVDDPSRVPDVLRPFGAISQAEINRSRRRSFEFERSHGSWLITTAAADLERPIAASPRNEPGVALKNGGGGWWHPVHYPPRVHARRPEARRQEGHARRGARRHGQARHHHARSRSEVEVFFKFRDFPGPFVFHCHNLEHEDVFMMARFDVV